LSNPAHDAPQPAWLAQPPRIHPVPTIIRRNGVNMTNSGDTESS
jgi:hypothetical protein